MTRLIGIYGASGFGREVMPVARAQFGLDNTTYVFLDDGDCGSSCNGYDVLSWAQFLERPEGERLVTLAIADGAIRESLAERSAQAGVEVCHVAAPNVWMGDDIVLGPGAILQPFVTLTSNVRIGSCFHANIYSYVAHDCVIGDFVTFAPQVQCNGNVHIADHAYVGTGAIIRQGRPDKPLVIGAGAVIGMGAVVTKDVPPGTTVIGNPARVMEKR